MSFFPTFSRKHRLRGCAAALGWTCAAATVITGASGAAHGAASVNYLITADVLDAGGQTVSGSAGATCNGSMGEIAGLSSASSTPEAVKAGYAGQLYDATGFTVTAPSPRVNTQLQLQLGAYMTMDDATELAIDPAIVAWSITQGPVAGISSRGVMATALVYQDTPAAVGGSYDGFESTVDFTIANFAYDAWEQQYFGSISPQSAPEVDADGTGQSNLFKFIAGLDPLDPASRFTLRISPAGGNAGGMSVTFSPVLTDRTYVVETCTDLPGANWQPLSTAGAVNGNSMSVIDPDCNCPAKFYRVEVSQ
jgi:hypothetical protein